MLFDQGKLEKMTVRAYQATAQADEVPQISEAPEDSYVVQVNPSSYTLNQTIDYTSRKAQGASASEAVFTRSPARTVSFTFVFDGTGVVPPPASALSGVPLAGAIASALSDDEEFVVMDEIGKFNHVVYTYSGQIHRPRKVLLLWGSLSLSCALTSLTYDFKLFRPDGTPLRATANCTFQEAISEVEREHAEANSSPDLTHIRQTREGDRLPLMVHDIYGDPKYYVAVARHNRLINFRRLEAGTRIELPRLASPGARR
jgi:hypothetical protein